MYFANRRLLGMGAVAALPLLGTLLVLFVLVHIIEVLLSGPFNEMRSILTGWFAVRPEKTIAQRSEP